MRAGWHAPAFFPEHPFCAPELAPIRAALERILKSHEPYPAVVFDRRWDLVAAKPLFPADPTTADAFESLARDRGES
jgi:hypothetical protein